MYTERQQPGTGERFIDLETLACAQKDRLQHRYHARLQLEQGYDAMQRYEPVITLDNVESHLHRLEVYSTLIADQVKPDDKYQITRHVAHRAIVHSALLAQDIIQSPRVWGLAHPETDQVGSGSKFARYLTNAPSIYLTQRLTLTGFANDLAKAISPARRYDADCYRAGRLAIGLGFLMADDALYGQHIDQEVSRLRDELKLWDGVIPDNFGDPRE
jgi:hypothetical protein